MIVGLGNADLGVESGEPRGVAADDHGLDTALAQFPHRECSDVATGSVDGDLHVVLLVLIGLMNTAYEPSMRQEIIHNLV